ncbi:MAG TPA: hypothetical protein VFY17_03510 [Pilimelia sp.]|nr:hypothetical protein [Pilimelia sp.]
MGTFVGTGSVTLTDGTAVPVRVYLRTRREGGMTEWGGTIESAEAGVFTGDLGRTLPLRLDIGAACRVTLGGAAQLVDEASIPVTGSGDFPD